MLLRFRLFQLFPLDVGSPINDGGTVALIIDGYTEGILVMWFFLCALLMGRLRLPIAIGSPILFFSLLILNSSVVWAQVPRPAEPAVTLRTGKLSVDAFTAPKSDLAPGERPPTIDPSQGISSTDLVRAALSSNAELAAARLEIEKARSRRRQAGLLPNPAVEFEQTSGVFNSPGERATSVGLSLPLELGGKRQRRIDLAEVELSATEAEIADRERRLANEIRAAYADVMAAQRELGITAELNDVDVETARVVRARVAEGDASPLELNLLRVEIERLRSRRALVDGRLQAAMLRLRQLAGISSTDPIQLREELLTPQLPESAATIEIAIELALNTRPDLRLARLTEQIAEAGYRLAKAQSAPDVTAFTRYSVVQSAFDQTPIGVLTDRDKLFTYGVSISLPVFNRNQGARAEAELAITQAQRRREFVESIVRSEVRSTWKRYESANLAIDTFEQGVIPRSNENIRAIRGAYQIGAFRVTELLTEQRRLIDAQREYTEALTERYRAMADLQAALGISIKP